jgi:hypothetical protein
MGMADSSYQKRCDNAISSVIKAAHRVAGENAVRAGLQHIVQLNKAPGGKMDYYLGVDTIHNLTNLFYYINAASSQRRHSLTHMMTMLKMFSFVQCLENRYTYKALGNLLRILQSRPSDGRLFDSFTSAAQCFDAIARLAQGGTEGTELMNVWKQFLDFKLRNAISHGDFVIRKDPGIVLIPSATLSDISGYGKKTTLKVGYSFQEVDRLYRKANDFQATFKKHMQQFDIGIGPRY